MKPSTRLTLVVLLCLVAAGAGAQCRFRNTAFSAGETLSYNLYYNWKFVWVKAGTASMAIANSHYKGQPAYRTSLTTRGNKKVVKEKTRMSGYIFVEAVLTGEIEYELRNTTDIIDFVRNRENPPKPEPVREAEINRMLGAADDVIEGVDEGVNDYMVGEEVKVISGPFNGFIGEIEDVNREKRTLKVMVKVFGRKTPLELENSQVERE